MKEWAIVGGAVLAILVVFGIAGSIWISNYNECREHFSFLYCMTRR